MENQSKLIDKSFKNNPFFYGVLIFLLLHFYLSVNTDLLQYSQHEDINIPFWYFYIIFTIDILVVLSLALIALYKKVGVITLPLFVMLHFICHNYFLSTFLYSDVSFLSFYVGLGLLVVIPRWKEFN